MELAFLGKLHKQQGHTMEGSRIEMQAGCWEDCWRSAKSDPIETLGEDMHMNE